MDYILLMMVGVICYTVNLIVVEVLAYLKEKNNPKKSPEP